MPENVSVCDGAAIHIYIELEVVLSKPCAPFFIEPTVHVLYLESSKRNIILYDFAGSQGRSRQNRKSRRKKSMKLSSSFASPISLNSSNAVDVIREDHHLMKLKCVRKMLFPVS